MLVGPLYGFELWAVLKMIKASETYYVGMKATDFMTDRVGYVNNAEGKIISEENHYQKKCLCFD